jgi:hypothetical protein
MIDDEALRHFRSRLRGQLIGPSDADYDSARAVWNGMIDKRPGLVARCEGSPTSPRPWPSPGSTAC